LKHEICIEIITYAMDNRFKLDTIWRNLHGAEGSSKSQEPSTSRLEDSSISREPSSSCFRGPHKWNQQASNIFIWIGLHKEIKIFGLVCLKRL
jgi:hypothetical protein